MISEEVGVKNGKQRYYVTGLVLQPFYKSIFMVLGEYSGKANPRAHARTHTHV
jgi:hypothetical protein